MGNKKGEMKEKKIRRQGIRRTEKEKEEDKDEEEQESMRKRIISIMLEMANTQQ